MTGIDHIAGHTFHARKGAVGNAFRYSIDYLLLDAEAEAKGPWLFSRNGRNLMAVHDADHGGPPTRGTGSAWVREVLRTHAAGGLVRRIELLAQPRVAGHVFNPVSFWLCRDADDALRAVIAEVTNTYGDRHSYLCVAPGQAVITAGNRLTAQKIFHVSPFQPVDGTYAFTFDIRPDRLNIRIEYDTAGGGVLATLSGRRRPLTDRAILWAAVRRPFGSRRVLGLIHWQALKLWLKGAPFRNRPAPPASEVS